MQETLKLLLELQELGITLNEAKILHGENDELDELKAKEKELRSKIKVDALSRYDRLARHGLAVVRIQSGMCMGCNMSIPQGDLNRMRKSSQEPMCPNCGRYLALD